MDTHYSRLLSRQSWLRIARLYWILDLFDSDTPHAVYIRPDPYSSAYIAITVETHQLKVSVELELLSFPMGQSEAEEECDGRWILRPEALTSERRRIK